MPLTSIQLAFLETFILKSAIGANIHDDRVALPEGQSVIDLRAAASKILKTVQDLKTPSDATATDVQALASARGAVSSMLDDPPTAAGVRAAAQEAKAMSAMHAEVLERVRLDREARAARKASLQKALGAVGDLGDAETLPQELQNLATLKQQVAEALAGTPPSGDDLDRAEGDIDRATALIDTVTKRIAAERAARAEQRKDILTQADKATVDDKAEASEKERRLELFKAVVSSLESAAPSGDDITAGDSALKLLLEYVQQVTKSLEEDRKPRFERAKAALDLLGKVDTSLPDATPPTEATPLVEAQSKLQTKLERLANWDNITSWGATDLDGVTEEITQIDQQFRQLRDKVTQAVEALRLAVEDARAKIAAPATGGAFSIAQSKTLSDDADTAEKEAQADILNAAAALTKLAGISKRAVQLARVRGDLDRRIKAVTAPTGGTKAEQDRWAVLKAAAENARDAVVIS